MTTSNRQAVIILGTSGSGKDSFSARAQGEVIKFSRPIKEYIENIYNLTPCALDSERVKDMLVKDIDGVLTKSTYRDILISFFETVQTTDPTMFFRSIRDKIEASNSELFIFNDVRTVKEAEFVNKMFDNSVTCVIIKREGKKGLASDRFIPMVAEVFNQVVTVTNDGSLPQLKSFGKHVCHIIQKGQHPCKLFSAYQTTLFMA